MAKTFYKRSPQRGGIFSPTNPLLNRVFVSRERRPIDLGIDDIINATSNKTSIPPDVTPDFSKIKSKINDGRFIPYDAGLINSELSILEGALAEKLQRNPFALRNDPEARNLVARIQNLPFDKKIVEAKANRERVDKWYDFIKDKGTEGQIYVDKNGVPQNFTNAEFYQAILDDDPNYRSFYAKDFGKIASINTNERFGNAIDFNNEIDGMFSKIEKDLLAQGVDNTVLNLFNNNTGMRVDNFIDASGYLKQKTGYDFSLDTNEKKIELAKASLLMDGKWRDILSNAAQNHIEQVTFNRMKRETPISILKKIPNGKSVLGEYTDEQVDVLSKISMFDLYQKSLNSEEVSNDIEQIKNFIENGAIVELVGFRADLFKEKDLKETNKSDINLGGGILGGSGSKNIEADQIHNIITGNVDREQASGHNDNTKIFDEKTGKWYKSKEYSWDDKDLGGALNKIFGLTKSSGENDVAYSHPEVKGYFAGQPIELKNAIEPKNAIVSMIERFVPQFDMNGNPVLDDKGNPVGEMKTFLRKKLYFSEDDIIDKELYTFNVVNNKIRPAKKKIAGTNIIGWHDNRTAYGKELGIEFGKEVPSYISNGFVQSEVGRSKGEMYGLLIDIPITEQQYIAMTQNKEAIRDEAARTRANAEKKTDINLQKFKELDKYLEK